MPTADCKHFDCGIPEQSTMQGVGNKLKARSPLTNMAWNLACFESWQLINVMEDYGLLRTFDHPILSIKFPA